jgi:hypothetical protein
LGCHNNNNNNNNKAENKLKYNSLGIEIQPEMYDYTSYNWSQWNSNEKLKEKSGSYTGKTFDRFTTADSCTGNISHNTEVLQCEWWGALLVHGKCREEKDCDKRQ